MRRREFNGYLGATALTTAAMTRPARANPTPPWALEADVAECCSCAIPCPCNFGRPTKQRCLGNRLIQITHGEIDGARLDGIAFVVTFEMGKWARIYLDQTVDAARLAAFEQVFPLAFAGFAKLAPVHEQVPLTVTRGDSTVAFAVPDSAVEMKLLLGLNGRRITIDGLPSPAFHGYTQYESVVHRHRSDALEFAHSETNGFTSRMIAASTSA
jgi:hypothetical protein